MAFFRFLLASWLQNLKFSSKTLTECILRCITILQVYESGYFPRTWFSCSHMVVKTILYCTRKYGYTGGCMSASCFLQPPRNGSTGQVPILEHKTFSMTVPGTPRTCKRCSSRTVARWLQKTVCWHTATSAATFPGTIQYGFYYHVTATESRSGKMAIKSSGASEEGTIEL